MKIFKGVMFVALVIGVAIVVFNGAFVAASVYFGPFYEGDAEQSRNFGIWLLGNAVVVTASALGGVAGYCRYLSKS